MFSKDRIKLKRNTKKTYVSIIMFVVLGSILFLSSGFVFEKKVSIMASPVNEKIDVGASKSITIYEWKYDHEKQKMQVLIDTDEIKRDFNSITTKAYQRSNGEQISSNIVFRYNDKIVIELKDFNKNYQQIALDLLGRESTDNQDNTKEKEIIKTLYTDDRKVKRGNINDQTDEKMISFITDKMIQKINTNINETKESIKENKNKIQENNQEIQEINSEKIYQTEDEIVESDANINALETEINSLKDDNKIFENDIKRMKDKIKKLKIKEREEKIK